MGTSTYILNRSPTKRLLGVKPEEAWVGSKPKLSHFRVFGSICFKYVPMKLDKNLTT